MRDAHQLAGEAVEAQRAAGRAYVALARSIPGGWVGESTEAAARLVAAMSAASTAARKVFDATAPAEEAEPEDDEERMERARYMRDIGW